MKICYLFHFLGQANNDMKIDFFFIFSHEKLVSDLDRQYQQALEEKSILAEQLQVGVILS